MRIVISGDLPPGESEIPRASRIAGRGKRRTAPRFADSLSRDFALPSRDELELLAMVLIVKALLFCWYGMLSFSSITTSGSPRAGI